VNFAPKPMDVRNAVRDIQVRTLAKLPRALDRLIYLSSMRDYNTGLYYHDGLSARFSPEIACEALADCHREAYRELISCSLQELVGQMEAYVASSNTRPEDFIAAWEGLEPYRVAIPAQPHPFSSEFLFSNFRLALAIVAERLAAAPQPSSPGA
jgi:hypothetical protein